MAEYLLTSSLTINLPRKQVFDFFSNAANLERITPPELKFHIVTAQPLELKQGALIDYELKMRGIPVKWRTEIYVWNPPHSFTDRQLSGPYKQWIHRHTFTELEENKTLIDDEVKYRLPLEPIGDIAHPLVRAELDRIFAFRQKAVAEILGAEQG